MTIVSLSKDTAYLSWLTFCRECNNRPLERGCTVFTLTLILRSRFSFLIHTRLGLQFWLGILKHTNNNQKACNSTQFRDDWESVAVQIVNDGVDDLKLEVVWMDWWSGQKSSWEVSCCCEIQDGAWASRRCCDCCYLRRGGRGRVGSVVSTAVVCRRNTRLITAVRSGAACPSGTQHSLRYNLNPHLLPLTRRGRRRPRSSPHTSCYCTYVATSHATSVHTVLYSLWNVTYCQPPWNILRANKHVQCSAKFSTAFETEWGIWGWE